MEYRNLGNSGTMVSALALGTMTFGGESDEATSRDVLDHFVESGGNLIDTADVYNQGASELTIGRWLSDRPAEREQVVITTKGRYAMGAGPNNLGTSRRHLRRALDNSLTRLNVDHIDLYQLHGWDPLTPIEESLQFAHDAIRSGKIAYYGLSNFTAWQLTKAVHLARAHGWSLPVTLQPQYSLLSRGIELEVVPAAQDAGLGLLPWSPLAAGWLTGKYQRDVAPTGRTRFAEDPLRGLEGWEKQNSRESTWRVLSVVEAIATARGVTSGEVALAWVRDRPGVTSVVLGVRTLGQLTGNVKAAKLCLTENEEASLNEASAPESVGYPYDERAVVQRSRKKAGGR